MTLQELEAALDGRRVWSMMGNGRYWNARRNGKTQTWKTRPGHFRIPVKAGLRATGAITETSRVGMWNPDGSWTGFSFLVMPDNTDPNLLRSMVGR